MCNILPSVNKKGEIKQIYPFNFSQLYSTPLLTIKDTVTRQLLCFPVTQIQLLMLFEEIFTLFTKAVLLIKQELVLT